MKTVLGQAGQVWPHNRSSHLTSFRFAQDAGELNHQTAVFHSSFAHFLRENRNCILLLPPWQK